MEPEGSLRGRLVCIVRLRTKGHGEGSLPCSQEPSTGPHPEPDQSNQYHPILSLKDPF
jgi:hypothetical protein